jgi:nicotinamidase-related amidase
VTAKKQTALIILDMLSEFRFEGADRLLRPAARIAPRIARLRLRMRNARQPVIYLNDTAGKWESDQSAFVRRCLAEDSKGHDIAQRLLPEDGDYFIFKPRHSGFYATPLADLLDMLHVGHLILTGQTSHQCVLFTAVDAHMRGYRLTVPRDCIAAASQTETRHALFVFTSALSASTPASTALRLR